MAVDYQHETSRCGDPHLHTHVIVPNRQPRADGVLVSIDSKSLHHEAKAAGIIYQAVLRHELHSERGFEWLPVDEFSGMAEITGVRKSCIHAWSRRSTRLREWARDNLVLIDGRPSAAQLAAAQKATRPPKPESKAWRELQQEWRADPRGLRLDRESHLAARRARRAAPRILADRAALARAAARIDKAVLTRADLVELVGAQLPVDAAGDPRLLIEQAVDAVSLRVSAPWQAHHREGHERYTVDAIIAEEIRVLQMVDARDNRSRVDVRDEDLDDLSPDQGDTVYAIAHSPFLVQPLQAPAGAGKTHSLRALRAGARRANKEVLVIAPTGKAVDEAMREQAGDRGLTVAKALALIADDELRVSPRTLMVVDEASMVGTAELKKLLSCAVAGHAKIMLVCDPYQLAPVKARGGMFEQLCEELPWSQRLTEVWRLRDPAERDASLALRPRQPVAQSCRLVSHQYDRVACSPERQAVVEVACALEGLADAYAIAVAGRDQRTANYRRCIKTALGFLVRAQRITHCTERERGGFPSALGARDQRIDVTGHVASGFIKCVEHGIGEPG